MTRSTLDPDHWRRRLAELAGRCGVPGAALGIAVGDQTVEIAYGVTNADTGVEVTTDTLFQIGSISKVWLATAIMRLVDDGKLGLDEPVVTYLPELALADPDTTARVTMRHLLTHTSGIDGDYFPDCGRGDDCVERYVAGLAALPLNHPLGATFSYCNAGFVVAGRVLEKLTGRLWDTAMRELVYEPLGLAHTVTLPEDALLHRAAVGHVHEGDEPPRRAPVWILPRSCGPAGLISSTVGDVLTFARLHLAGGLAADGTRVLSAESVAAMQAEQVRLPEPHTRADSWGLGWFRPEWNGTRLVAHNGGTIGQYAFLRVVPDRGIAVTLLTNGGRAADLYHELFREVFAGIAGVEMAAPLAPPDPEAAADVTAYAGVYERTGVRLEVRQDADGARLRLVSTQETPGLDHPPREFDLVPGGGSIFAFRPPGVTTWTPLTFYTLPDGSPYVFDGSRSTPKIATPSP